MFQGKDSELNTWWDFAFQSRLREGLSNKMSHQLPAVDMNWKPHCMVTHKYVPISPQTI